jgi:hypothetical protein
MAVTDLTDDLPWWTRQGAGPTGGPAATPQGAGGQPGAGNSASWLDYLSQMFGISPAQAAQLSQSGGNPANLPSPNASNMAFAGHVGATNPDGSFNPPPGQNPPITNFGNPAPTTGPGPGNVGPVNLSPPAPAGPSILPQARGVAVPPGPMASGPAPAGPSILAQARGVAVQPGPMEPGSTTMPAAAGPAAATPAAPVPGPLATGGAGGMGATSNPRFVQLDRPNMSPAGGFGRGGPPQMTALNLAGLFGGGQPNPNAPAANAQPVSGRVAGPLASGGGTIPRSYPGEGWDIDAQGNPIPSYGSGRPDMNPGQLARAVKKPNWYRNV